MKFLPLIVLLISIVVISSSSNYNFEGKEEKAYCRK
jgi:hypothetical protein